MLYDGPTQRRLQHLVQHHSLRLPAQSVLDLALGRRFELGRAVLKTDVQLFNVFNEDSHDWWQTLLVPPGDEYVPDGYIFPRRLTVRLGLTF